MLDLALFAFLVGFIAVGFRRPFVWVLAYLYVDILAPGKMGWTLMPALQPSLLTFVAAFAGWLLTDPKHGSRFTVRQGIMLALLLYCMWTTGRADFPEFAAEKWSWVWKALFFAIFLPLTITTRARLEGALLIMILTVSAIIISAGIKVVLGGGGYEAQLFFVNDNSGLYESSTLATVAICIIPLIVWFNKYGTIFPPEWRVKLFSAGLVFACLLMPVGTEARTGLICIAVLLVLALRDVKRRLTFIVAGVTLGLVALPFLPASYYERMSTLGSTDGDESASTRVAVWEWTIDYATENPTGGGFDAFRGNSFTYNMPIREQQGNTTAVEYQEVTDEARAYHSAVFEMLGEQGWPGLFMWLLLHGLGLWQMERLRRRWRKRQRNGEAEGREWIAPLATALEYAQIVYLVGSLFQGIAYQPFVLMIVALQCAFWSYCKRIDSHEARQRRALRQASAALPAGDAVAAG
ncbi:MAG: O-antigen ligase family protein [Sphingomonadaceae bacterium]|nr:O-antigen ligase family protein [Sphingomonadaceae bacterium]MCP5390182.1 O-antigen ligase family protein [Sphingomonadaceae bacterium]MCP5392485.1 O-antigen ligase family protein [Sphingomonadaceae bacterium]